MNYLEQHELNDDYQIIDIRSNHFYNGWKNDHGVSGHIQGAIDFPVEWFSFEDNPDCIKEEFERRMIDPQLPTVIYADDDIDEKSYQNFEEHGFNDLFVLKGGINRYNGTLNRMENYQLLVSTDWVNDLIHGKNPEGYHGQKFKIVEIAYPNTLDDYLAGHVDGAISLMANEICEKPGPEDPEEYEKYSLEEQLKFWMFPSDEAIKEVLESAGIDKDTLVILYGSTEHLFATSAAFRAAFVMDYAGIKDVRIMDGGKKKWRLDGKPFSKTDQREDPYGTRPVEFGTEIPSNPSIQFSYEDELRMIEDEESVIASVRSWEEYIGIDSAYNYIEEAGDIKNSRYAYGDDGKSYANIDNTTFNYEIIAKLWALWGITPDKTISFHCGSGWRAAQTYYIAKAIGMENIGVYTGGWYEWSRREGSPKKPLGMPEDSPESTPHEHY